ncbi:cytochrome P450 [Methylobrevis pamukkalensis]|uniref:Cytochrome P450 n=1 Tax=Methylobrevis pamukkalensis TaxID=1439726 RepID=A0A1E3H6L0_9HYPH|nr:cytochrome P450 [Methylobrevis pamukkalensis]ODN71775.1 Cytochrome P450 [Methylobrevis pamukkalensis]
MLDPADVRIVLGGTPEPFTSATDEKRAALGHFEPHNALVTRGAERTIRRRLNEEALETAHPVHSHVDGFRTIVREETTALTTEAAGSGELDWDAFSQAWFRVVRRVVLGNAARDDHALTDLMARLRGRANWAFAMPKDRRARDELHRRLQAHVDRAEPGSLAARVAGQPEAAFATHQMAQWLFAFDPAGMTTFRALALIVSNDDALARAEAEISAGGPDPAFLKACALETLRLFPTTPAILRQTTTAASLRAGRLPGDAGVLVYAPFFHRMSGLPDADRFAPVRWQGRDAEELLPFVPFSAGAAVCPAKHLVPLLVAEALRELLSRHRYAVLAPGWLAQAPRLRGTLNNYAIRLTLHPIPRRT